MENKGHMKYLEKLGAGLHSSSGYVKWQLTQAASDRASARG